MDCAEKNKQRHIDCVFGAEQILADPIQPMLGMILGLRCEQHLDAGVVDVCTLHPHGGFAAAKKAVCASTGTIAPELFELLSKNIGQWGTVDAHQMIHVAARFRCIGIAVDAGAGEVGAAGDHDRLINDHEFVVHQSAAAAAIGGVIQQGNSGVLQQCNGIAAMGFLRCRDAITIAIGQSIQPMPALTFLLREMAHLLLTPRSAVVRSAQQRRADGLG